MMSSATFYTGASMTQNEELIEETSSENACRGKRNFAGTDVRPDNFSGGESGDVLFRPENRAAENRPSVSAETVLLVSSDGSSRMAMRQFFEMEKIAVIESGGGESLFRMMTPEVSVLLIDSALTDTSPEMVVRQVQERFPELPIIYMDEPGTDPARRSRIVRSVAYCVVKPCERGHLLAVIRQAMKTSRFARENRALRQTIRTPVFPVPMVGVSATIQTLRKQIEAFARLDNTILITGERGTGKSTIAQQIHQAGPRARYPFLVVSCNAMPPEILEADLFGYVRGAIPGVTGDRPGRIELAHRGTIFLDRIEDLSPSLQIRLFQFLQERTTRRLGQNEARHVDTRIIASTGSDLAIACVQGRFRDELYFRLNALTVSAPPLRDRTEDIPTLAREIMSRIARLTSRNLSILSTGAINKLRQYSWPYNIRELESVLQKAMETAPDTVITENDISFDTMIQDGRSPDGAMGLAGLTMAEIERRAIIETINACGGNRAQSARKLGVSEKTIYNKIKQFKLRGIV